MLLTDFLGRALLIDLDQRAHTHTQQAKSPIQVDPLERQACALAYGVGIVGGLRDAQVSRHTFEIVIAQLDADGAALVALALQVFGHPLAQLREDGAKRLAVLHWVQVAFEGGLAAHGHRFAVRDHRPVVTAPGGVVHPGAGGLPELADQPVSIARRQIADGVYA